MNGAGYFIAPSFLLQEGGRVGDVPAIVSLPLVAFLVRCEPGKDGVKLTVPALLSSPYGEGSLFGCLPEGRLARKR